MSIPFAGGRIRPWLPSDAASLVRLADDKAVWRNLRDAFPHPYSRKDARAWIRAARREAPCRHFAIEIEAGTGAGHAGPDLAGGIGLMLQSDVNAGTAEIGYWLGRSFWGRGLMSSALPAFAAFAFEAYRLRRLYARVFAWNAASMRVLEKCGFAAEGRLRGSALKDGEVVDEIVYGKLAGEGGQAPSR
jgi:RimJ/RimL family protein N-acetyltransferase